MPSAARTLKTCSRCGEAKPHEAFHRRRHYSRDGHRAACKACTSAETKKARESRSGTQSDEERRKQQVRYQTRRLIMAGELVPQRCGVCGCRDVQAHHPSYEGDDAARTVEWLCPLHHAQAHGVRAWTKQMDLFPETGPSMRKAPNERSVTYHAM